MRWFAVLEFLLKNEKFLKSQHVKPGPRTVTAKPALWISYWISTGPFVQNRPACAPPQNCPVNVPTRYNAFQPGCQRRKPLRLLIKPDLSTETGPFTTTTIFVYLSLYKTVNSKQWWTAALH
jgi:hypothetical protein